MRFALFKAVVIAVLLNAIPARSQIAQLSPVEIEMRNAATGFVNMRETGLFLLIGECSHLLANSPVNVDAVARGWFERNKPELEASSAWLDRYLTFLQTNNPELWRKASANLLSSTTSGSLQNARIFFSRKPPDRARCETALTPYSVPQADIRTMALNPGYEQFAEFPATLARIRAEPGFAVPPHLKFGMEKGGQYISGLGNLASLDAAEAARERGDGPARIAIFKGLAERGDGNATTQVGIIYLTGQQVAKDEAAAYRWFYGAWSQSNMDGLNALGVMNRDGVGVPVNLPLAGAAFYLSKAGAGSREAFDRASGNLDKVASRLNPETASQIACLRLSALDDGLRAPIRGLPPLVVGKTLSNPERRLGDIVKDLSDVYKNANCQ